MTLTLVLVATNRAQDTARASTIAPSPVRVVTQSVPGTNEISFSEFLHEVATANLDYAAQRYNVSIAEAAIAAARVFPNPSLELNGGRDVTHGGTQRLPDTLGAGLTQTIELGGKRKYRILGARQNHAAAAATLEDFLRNLKLDAAAAYADALARSRSADQKRQSAGYLQRLVDTQRARFQAGDINQADLLQTQVEEQQFQNEVLSAEAESRNAALALSAFLGRDRGQTLLVPKGTLEMAARDFDLSNLLDDGLNHRPDLVALRLVRDAAQSKTTEEKRNRIPDVDVGPNWTHSTRSENLVSPSPEADAIGFSFSIPLPIWNRNKAAIAAARSNAEQAQRRVESAELKAEVQIRQAATAYRSAVERVRQYQSGILRDADAVLESKRFSYERGQTTLLELLAAQRTASDVRAAYIDALADQAGALILLQRATGIFEIQF